MTQIVGTQTYPQCLMNPFLAPLRKCLEKNDNNESAFFCERCTSLTHEVTGDDSKTKPHRSRSMMNHYHVMWGEMNLMKLRKFIIQFKKRTQRTNA